MKFVCDGCGEVDHVLMDGYMVGDRLLEGVMFKITVKKEKFQEVLVAHVCEENKGYFKDIHLNIKEWEKEMEEYARLDRERNGCCDMQCPKCNQQEVIQIKED